MSTLPGGTVTFVFTDIEGSTQLLQELGDEGYGRVSGDHRRLVRETFGARGGTEIDTQGDAFFFSFPRARDAVAAAVDAQRALRDHEWPDGTGGARADGRAHRRAARRARRATSASTSCAPRASRPRATAARSSSRRRRARCSATSCPDGVAVHDLGQQDLKDVQHEHIYELTIDGRSLAGKPLKTEKPKSPEEDMGARFAERINAMVEGQLESAFENLLKKRQRE